MWLNRDNNVVDISFEKKTIYVLVLYLSINNRLIISPLHYYYTSIRKGTIWFKY